MDRIAKKLSRFEVRQNKLRNEDKENEWLEFTSPLLKRKKKKKPPVSIADKVSIACKVLIDFEKVADVAKEFRVSVSYISSIVSKIKKNKKAFDELHEKHEEKQVQRRAVQRALLVLIN